MHCYVIHKYICLYCENIIIGSVIKYFTGFQILAFTSATIETSLATPSMTPTLHIYQTREFLNTIGKNGYIHMLWINIKDM